MLPNYTSFSTLSDQAYYSAAQASVPPLPSQITFESEPQLNELLPIQAASATASMCQARKRTGRSDRHSKIRTAHGERDRRMRLSVQVAHQFFALQDRLGFDKASKTIDWLLTQAKDSIDQLSSTSSSELRKEEIPTDHSPFSDIEPEPVHATEIAQKRNKAVEGQQRSKDLRAKARERARERAREKRMVSCQLDQLVPAAISSADALIDVDCDGMEYYYDLLNEILNGGFCSVDIEDIEGSTSAAVHFN